jgi:hypothetical protein
VILFKHSPSAPPYLQIYHGENADPTAQALLIDFSTVKSFEAAFQENYEAIEQQDSIAELNPAEHG